ncbi:hypothetical protein SAMN02910400_00597 [Lachnospiraceae bacterium C10]|nr:hypothetical protein SAMN02910400_00597 [Lachnospiraceae bacterium C10]
MVYAIYTVLNLNEFDDKELAAAGAGKGKLSIDLGTFGDVLDSATGGSAGVAAFFLKKEYNERVGNYLKWEWDDLTQEVGMAWNDFKQEVLSWW